MSSSCSTILSFSYLDSVISIQSCNSALVFLPIKSIVWMNPLSYEKGKDVFKNYGDSIFLLSPSWSICKHGIYKSHLAKIMSNWFVNKGGAALQVVCSCLLHLCVCSLVLDRLPLPRWVFAVAELKHAACWRSLPPLQDGHREHQLMLLGETATARHTASLELLWAARQAPQMSGAWLQINNSGVLGKTRYSVFQSWVWSVCMPLLQRRR